MENKPVINDYLNEIAKQGVKVTVRKKSESALMRFIGALFKITGISPKFMDEYFTTIGTTIYVPDRFYDFPEIRLLETIIHECVHARDFSKNPFLFVFMYLFPQILSSLALIAIFAFLNINLLWFLFALVFLAPIPAIGRFILEIRAYRTSIIYFKVVYGYTDTELKSLYKWIIGQLATKYYYFTWPFPKHMEKVLEERDFMSKEEYKQITKFLEVNVDRLR
jgi:hypothetical protein